MTRKKKKAVAQKLVADKKKEEKEMEILDAKEKKEAECLVKLAKKEKEIEKEGKEKGKGKKKVEGGGQVGVASTVDQGSQMQGGNQSGMKRKAVLSEVTGDLVTQSADVIVLGDDDVTSEELILNVSIVDVMDNIESEAPNSYTKVMEFLKKVKYEYLTFQK